MRRTAPFLSALAVAGALLVAVAPAAFADPAAEVSPGSVAPGGDVTVSVSCGPFAGAAPTSLGATSQAFAEGTVELGRVTGADDARSGPVYRGTARIAPAADLEVAPDAVGPDAAWTIDGTCPAAPGGQDKPWSATLDVARGETQPCGSATAASCATGHPCPQDRGTPSPHGDACPTGRPCAPPEPQPRTPASYDPGCLPATLGHGVQAGEGGAFNDSVPALAAGALLIAGAFGAALHRLRRRNPAGDV
ncbi:hypothetical protein OHS71_07665 [Streptomyces sp. NBC_00377]|uniref:hypothetical protein n=1 Tax=unclassified Streptomyces TaxID=2593676 RepID=UPI002E232CB7|nr:MULTISPECIES: hypothetical protein [unclassified Streptomyces]